MANAVKLASAETHSTDKRKGNFNLCSWVVVDNAGLVGGEVIG